MTTKLRSAGLAVETLPGPPLLPPGLTPLETLPARPRARQSRRDRRARGALAARPRDARAAVRHGPPPRSTRDHGLRRPTTFQWEFTDPDVPTWHLTVDNGSSRSPGGRGAQHPDLRLRLAYQDWVDIVGQRLDPLRAVATGRLRPRGNPLALARLRKVFPPE